MCTQFGIRLVLAPYTLISIVISHKHSLLAPTLNVMTQSKSCKIIQAEAVGIKIRIDPSTHKYSHSHSPKWYVESERVRKRVQERKIMKSTQILIIQQNLSNLEFWWVCVFTLDFICPETGKIFLVIPYGQKWAVCNFFNRLHIFVCVVSWLWWWRWWRQRRREVCVCEQSVSFGFVHSRTSSVNTDVFTMSNNWIHYLAHFMRTKGVQNQDYIYCSSLLTDLVSFGCSIVTWRYACTNILRIIL